jgi:hypothetical protein
MSQEKTYNGILGALARLDAALDANAGELAHLDGTRQRFSSLVAGAQEAAREQAELAAGKQEASRRQARLLAEGQRLATGIDRLLREFYGNGSEKLVEFGLKPFRGRSRRTAAEGPEAPAPTPPPVLEAAAPDDVEV